MREPSEWVEIRNLKRQNRVIPFIGSGLSNQVGLPSTTDIIEMMADELGWDPDIMMETTPELSQLAQYYVAEKGKIGFLRNKMNTKFVEKQIDAKTSPSHLALADCNFPIIYTTNYDDAIEDALRARGKSPKTIRNLKDLGTITGKEDEHLVIKFHGTFDDDLSIVLTEQSFFDRLTFEKPMDIRLRSDVLGKTMLFLGYSLNDINMRYLLYKLHKQRKEEEVTDCPVGYLITFYRNDIMEKLFRHFDVRLIELEGDRTKALSKFLTFLASNDNP